jgi:hypothetical protein
MKTRAWWLGVGLAAFATVSVAEVYRCKAPGGSVTYQEIACDAASAGGTIPIPASFPEVNLAERDRLLQREAALDARNLRREELDTALRIAREERLAREAEARAERDRLAAAAAGTGPYAIAMPLRLRPLLHRRPVAIRQ